MTMQVQWGVSTDFWYDFVEASPGATFFHTPGWYQAMAKRFGYRPQALHVRFETGEEALVPFATRRLFKGLLKTAESGIEGGYGGLVAPHPLTPAQVEAVYRELHARHPDLRVVGNPHEAFDNAPAGAPATADATQVIPLTTWEAQLARMTGARQKSIRRAAAEDYDVVISQGLEEADVATFYDIYAEHAAEWDDKRWVRDEAYFRALIRYAGKQLVLFTAYHDGIPAGFRLLACHGTVAIALNVARAKRYASWNVGPELAARSMAWCHEQGFKGLDLMPSGQLDSVKAYKASFGAEAAPFATAVYTGKLGACLASMRRLATRAPLPAATPS